MVIELCVYLFSYIRTNNTRTNYAVFMLSDKHLIFCCIYSFYGNKLQCKIEASYFAGTSFARLYFPFRSTNHITLYSIRPRSYTTNSATQLWQRKKKGYVNVVIDVRSNSRHERIDLIVAPIVGNLELRFILRGVNTIVYIRYIPLYIYNIT